MRHHGTFMKISITEVCTGESLKTGEEKKPRGMIYSSIYPQMALMYMSLQLTIAGQLI